MTVLPLSPVSQDAAHADHSDEEIWTIVVGGGSGRRFGTLKQYEELGGRRVLDWALSAAGSVSDGVVLVVPEGFANESGTVVGGATRSESVRRGLAVVPESATIICVHDAARPFAGAATFSLVIDAIFAGADGALPGVAVTDTIKVVSPDGVVESTPDRSTLVAVQTPQAFRASMLRRAHAAEGEGTDDGALVEAVGGRVVVVVGEPDNRKITHPDDLVWARGRLTAEV